MGQVAIPGVMRPGGQGPSAYTTGTMDDQGKLVAQTGQVFQVRMEGRKTDTNRETDRQRERKKERMKTRMTARMKTRMKARKKG